MAKSNNRKSATLTLAKIFDNLGEFTELVKNEGGHDIKMFKLDDESFFKSNFSLPQCDNRN